MFGSSVGFEARRPLDEGNAHAVLLAGGQQLTDGLRSLGLEHAVAHEAQRAICAITVDVARRRDCAGPARRPTRCLRRCHAHQDAKAPTAPHFPG
jgi:hypothetical protein